jgi:putative endonuclease
MHNIGLSGHLIGKRGEDLACAYLQRHGYRILQRNFKARYGEIDIVSEKDGILVFVEVKTRTSDIFGTPEESITPKKLQEVIKAAMYYKQLHRDSPESLRIDVIGVRWDTSLKSHEITHTPNVTGY